MAPDSGRDDRRDTDRPGYPGEKARQGSILLKTRTHRLIFIGGLLICVIVAILLAAL